VWEVGGYRIELGLHAYPSSLVAADDLAHLWQVDNSGNPPSLKSSKRHFRKANVVVWIQVLPINHKDKTDGSNPSASSIAERLSGIVDELIVGDVKVDHCGNELYPPLQPRPMSPRESFLRDVESGRVPRVEKALVAGADANARDSQQTSVLALAVTRGHKDLVRLLLRSGADPNSVLGRAGTVMFRVISRPGAYRSADLPRILANQIEILDDLLASGADMEARDGEGQTFFLVVARFNADDGSPVVLLKSLLERGASVAASDREGRTALMLAILHTHPKVTRETLQVLLDAGADVNARDGSGKTAMAYARERAVRYGYNESTSVLQILTDAGGVE
jgi:hypothetical protein